jgi:hypothetical protein
MEFSFSVLKLFQCVDIHFSGDESEPIDSVSQAGGMQRGALQWDGTLTSTVKLSSSCLFHPEDGDCNVCHNTMTTAAQDMAKL